MQTIPELNAKFNFGIFVGNASVLLQHFPFDGDFCYRPAVISEIEAGFSEK